MADEHDEIHEMLAELDPESRVLYAEGVLGRDAIEFFRSELGQYMIGCAKQEYADAMYALKGTGAWRRRRIQELQNRVWRAENFVYWLKELIVRGKQAENLLDNEDGHG